METLNTRGRPVVEIVDVSKSYPAAGAAVGAVRGVSLSVCAGERFALLGTSGAGKSTLLNLIAGLDAPSAGRIAVSGRELTDLDAGQLAAHRRDAIGMVFQSYNLVGWRTAQQNVELPLSFAGIPASERRSRASAALHSVGLGHRLDHRPAELSGGEQQRVAIARALINRPAVLLADEPTGNLDSETAARIVELIAESARAAETSVILVTHDEHLAARFGDRVGTMQDGRLELEARGGAS